MPKAAVLGGLLALFTMPTFVHPQLNSLLSMPDPASAKPGL